MHDSAFQPMPTGPMTSSERAKFEAAATQEQPVAPANKPPVTFNFSYEIDPLGSRTVFNRRRCAKQMLVAAEKLIARDLAAMNAACDGKSGIYTELGALVRLVNYLGSN